MKWRSREPSHSGPVEPLVGEPETVVGLGHLRHMRFAFRSHRAVDPAPVAPVALDLVLGDKPAQVLQAALPQAHVTAHDLQFLHHAVGVDVEHEARVAARGAEAGSFRLDEDDAVPRPVEGELAGDGQSTTPGADDRPVGGLVRPQSARWRRRRKLVVPPVVVQVVRQHPCSGLKGSSPHCSLRR